MMSNTKKEKNYGHYFVFEPGDKVSLVIPNDDIIEEEFTVMGIVKEINVNNKIYQIVSLNNGEKKLANELRPPYPEYKEHRDAHFEFLNINSPNRKKKRAKKKSASTKDYKPNYKLNVGIPKIKK